MYSAQQELFTRLLIDLRRFFDTKGIVVYDTFLPPATVAYPFVYLGSFPQADTPTKTNLIGTVSPVIHVYHNNPLQRGTVSTMIEEIKRICRNIEETDHFKWLVTIPNQDIIPDNTVKPPLMHGIIEPVFKFS